MALRLRPTDTSFYDLFTISAQHIVTGAGLLAEIGCRYAIVGHSERRTYYGESDAYVANKAAALFSAGIAAVVLVLAGGTTWASDGFWAPDGAYSRFVSPIIGVVWIVVISGLLVMRGPSTAGAVERPAVPAA